MNALRVVDEYLQSHRAPYAILRDIQSSLHCKHISIWLLDEPGTLLECTHTVEPQAGALLGKLMRARKSPKPIARHALKNWILKTCRPQWLDAKAPLSHFNLLARQLIAAPLVARHKLIGVLIVIQKIGKPGFTHADRTLVHELALDMAVAIQNTQLYERQHQSAERQKLLNQISTHLHQTLDLDELIPRIFTEVNKAHQSRSPVHLAGG